MINREQVRLAEALLKQKFEESKFFAAHPEQKVYRLEHTYRVANIGRQIAIREGFDETEMIIACLLHDISYCEEFDEDGWKEHGRRSAQITRPFLMELGLAEERVNEICYGIAIHVDDKADFPGERTPFAVSVSDADNIDRFDAYRIHETLCHDGFIQKSTREKLEISVKRLARLYELKVIQMGTRSAEEIWRERISFYITFYDKLVAQLNCSMSVME